MGPRSTCRHREVGRRPLGPTSVDDVKQQDSVRGLPRAWPRAAARGHGNILGASAHDHGCQRIPRQCASAVDHAFRGRTIRHQGPPHQIAEARRRVEANPTDPQLRFDLGRFLFAAEQYTEAIPELQRAKNNPHVRTQALLLLGRCFERKNMLDLAVNQLIEAEKDLGTLDNTKKELLYEKALVLQRMGRTEEYLENLKLIYEADYGYRDVAERVESSYQTS